MAYEEEKTGNNSAGGIDFSNMVLQEDRPEIPQMGDNTGPPIVKAQPNDRPSWPEPPKKEEVKTEKTDEIIPEPKKDEKPEVVKPGSETAKPGDEIDTTAKADDNKDKVGEGLFDDFEITGKPGKDDGLFVELGATLGFDVKNKAELIAEVAVLKNKSGAPVYANDEVKAYVEEVNEIALKGGDFMAFVDDKKELASIEKQNQTYTGKLENFEKLRGSTSVEEMKNLILSHEETQGRPASYIAEVKKGFEELSDAQILREGYTLVDKYIDEVKYRLGENGKRVETLKGKVANAVKLAEDNEKLARQVLEKAVASYESPVDDRFTKPVREQAQRLLSGENRTVTLPAKLIDALFFEEGKFSETKAIDLIANSVFGPQIISHMKAKASKGLFRKMQDVQLDRNGAQTTAITDTNGGAIDWGAAAKKIKESK